jgi:hypothetical protein
MLQICAKSEFAVATSFLAFKVLRLSNSLLVDHFFLQQTNIPQITIFIGLAWYELRTRDLWIEYRGLELKEANNAWNRSGCPKFVEKNIADFWILSSDHCLSCMAEWPEVQDKLNTYCQVWKVFKKLWTLMKFLLDIRLWGQTHARRLKYPFFQKWCSGDPCLK